MVKTNSKHLFDQNVQTPRQDRSIAKSKLELIPITDEILPSIETPRSERVPTSAFARGAIHIDSPPPQDPRTEYNHLRREAENQSPVKRKRGPSPTIGADNRRREVVYLPIREGRTTYIPQPVDHGLREFPRHEQRPNLANKIVYLPLDDNSKVQSFHRQDRDYAVNRSDTQSSTAQVYLDNAPRYSVQPRDHNSGVKYQYIPLGSVQQRRNPEDSNHSSTSLISFNDSSDTILTHRSLNDEHTHRSLIPLDSPTLRSQYRQYDEVSRVVRQDMVPRRSPSEIQRKQHLQRRPQGPDEIPVL